MVKLVVAIALALALTVAAWAASTPTVAIVSVHPLVVRGSAWPKHVRVRAELVASGVRRVRVVRTTASGRFAINFGELAKTDRCLGTVGVSVTGGGVREGAKLVQPECPPPLAPAP